MSYPYPTHPIKPEHAHLILAFIATLLGIYTAVSLAARTCKWACSRRRQAEENQPVHPGV